MTHSPVHLSTRELRGRIENPGTQLVDARPMDAYNRWRLDGEARGGHVRGARALPFTWSAYLHWIEIVRAKGLEPDRSLVVYGQSEDETETVARLFHRAEFQDVGVYHGFREEWCADGPADPGVRGGGFGFGTRMTPGRGLHPTRFSERPPRR